MRQTTDELAQHGAARWCWEVARRDDTRVARRLYRPQAVEGVDRLNEGAVRDGVFHFLDQIGVMAWLAEVHGAAMPREMGPYVQDVVLDGLKTRCGMDSMHALPALWCRDDARMPLVGCNAQPGRQGVCQRGAATRPGARTPGPISPETLANNLVKLHLRDLEGVCNGAIRALAQAGVCDTPVTGMADGTDLDPTLRSTGCGQVTRHVRLADTWGNRQAIEVTVYGWNGLRLSDAVTTMPWAVKGGQIQEHEALWARAVVTPARMTLAGAARLAKGVCATGVWDGPTLWWLDPQGIRWVVPAQPHRAVTAAARAQAAAGEALPVGRRVHTVRHGQGRTAGPERVEPEVVGLTALTTDDQYGTLAHG
jgi:hypothetical protein